MLIKSPDFNFDKLPGNVALMQKVIQDARSEVMSPEEKLRIREKEEEERLARDGAARVAALYEERLTGSMKFKGILSLKTPNKQVERSGYACLISPQYNIRLDLARYQALELRLKSDGRVYVMQIKTDSSNPDDLYQAIIPPLPAGEWSRVQIPFQDFILTWRGYVENERPHINLSQIQHVSILMAEREDGPFELQVDWIRAVRTNGPGGSERYSGVTYRPPSDQL
eukprot:TRINITY_DN8783_c0_g1_i1.p1 TRINITY_DN8783_c0_g1~~TRINITY_DN8783_c0_g1_i1.p1  ORF type:complete len:226 (-),score=49.33 TRINITY_DN8783_c0_g1_i1:161-838(-)